MAQLFFKGTELIWTDDTKHLRNTPGTSHGMKII